MASELRVADDLTLPAGVVTQTLAILAERRAGKSSTGVRLAELMFLLGLPWVAIDPKGDWWGMRAAGTGPGLKIPVFGGLRGDLPLTPESGRLIAELIAEQNLTCILDVSDFPSDAAQTRFLTDFARHLFDLHRKNPAPRHLFLEEADEYCPQVVRSEQARCVHAWAKIVKQGGAFGLGMTLLSQRSAVVNKNILSQMGTLIALRTTSSLDRAAVKDWIDYHAGNREIIDSLPSLADGEGWIISPHWLARHGQPAIQRVQFDPRTTFDSGATPTMTGTVRPPATLADVDLGALAARMQAVAEQAADSDPAELRKRIKALDRQLAAARRGEPASTETEALRSQVAALTAELEQERARTPERIEVPVVVPGDIAALEQAIAGARDMADGLELALSRATRPEPKPAPAVRSAPARPAPEPRTAPAADAGEGPPLGRAQRAILTVLAQFPDGRTKNQIATLSGYSVKSSTFANTLSSLRTAGLITRGNPVLITAEGTAALGEWETLPSGAALVEHWMGRISKSERALLRVLLDAWPAPLSKDQIGAASGYSATSSTFANALSRLRTLELISGYGEMLADETLAQAAREDIRA